MPNLANIGFKVKSSSFNSRAIMSASDRAARRVLGKSGGVVRRQARSLIRKPGKSKRTRYSQPGKPPKNQTGILKDFILYSYDHKSVAIGPVRQPAKARNLLEILEYGGQTRNTNSKSSGYGGSYRAKARPFLRPAYEKQEDYILGLWKNSIK